MTRGLIRWTERLADLTRLFETEMLLVRAATASRVPDRLRFTAEYRPFRPVNLTNGR
jgi:hypothetical protein